METSSWARNCGREVYSHWCPARRRALLRDSGSPRGPPGRRCLRQEPPHPAAFRPAAAAATLGPAQTLRHTFAWHRREARRGQSCPRRDCPVPGLTFSFAPSRAEPRAPRAQPSASGSSPPAECSRGLNSRPPLRLGATRAPSASRRQRHRPRGPRAGSCGPRGGQVGAAVAPPGERGSRSPGRGPAAAKRREPRGAEPAPPALAAPVSAGGRGAPPTPLGAPARPPGRAARSSSA